MRKVFLAILIAVLFSSMVYADVTYSAKSTITEDNAMEVINLDVIPIIELNTNNRPRKNINDNSTYVAPLIMPAQQENPSLNLNLNNIKNIKKGAILPNDNVSQTITNVVQYFDAAYDKVFSHLLGIVDNSDFELVSYDTESGRIFVNYKNQKPIYITVSQYNSENVLVKITPADGVYDIPASMTDQIFDELKRSLYTK